MVGFSVRKRVIRLQTIEKSVESSRSSPETGAGEGFGAPLRLPSLRTETSGTFIQKNAMRERPKRLADTRHDAFTYGMIPFRLPTRAQCG